MVNKSDTAHHSLLVCRVRLIGKDGIIGNTKNSGGEYKPLHYFVSQFRVLQFGLVYLFGVLGFFKNELLGYFYPIPEFFADVR